MTLRLLVATTLALAMAAAAEADPRPARAVVVLPLEGGPAPEVVTTAQAARDLLEARLADRSDLRVVERAALDRVLAEQALLGATEPAGAARIGGLVAAQVAVTGTVGQQEGKWRVLLRAISVPEGALLATSDRSGDEGALLTTVEAAADDLARGLAGAKRPDALREDRRAAASTAYLRGLGLHRAGRAAEAIGAFLEAQRLATRFVEARYWMGLAFERLGRPDQAKAALRRFLEEAPTHSLAEDARRRLSTLPKASITSTRSGDAAWTLLEAYLSGAPDPERAAVLSRRLEHGELTGAELEATLDVADSWTDVTGLLDALAHVDPERFLVRVALDTSQYGAYLGAPGVIDQIRSIVTPTRADGLARALLDPSPRRRDEALTILEFLHSRRGAMPKLESEETRRRLDQGETRAADSVDPSVSLRPILLHLDEPEAVGRWGRRILNPSYAPAYRTALIVGFQSRLVRDPVLLDGVVDLLGDGDTALRRASAAAMAWITSIPGSGTKEEQRTWTGRVIAAQARAAILARRILAERRFPDEAEDYWAVLGPTQPADATLSRALLGSTSASERAIGARLSVADPALLTERIPALLDDGDRRVRAGAIGALASHPDPKAAGRLLVAWWRRREGLDAAAAHEMLLSDRSALTGALSWLQRRLTPLTEGPPTQAPSDPDGWDALFR